MASVGRATKLPAKLCSQVTHTCEVSSPIGNILITSCQKGVHEVHIDPKIDDVNFSPDQNVDVSLVPNYSEIALGNAAQRCVLWLQRYFENPNKIKNADLPPLCSLLGSGFRSKAWQTLLSSSHSGQTTSYKELATRMNNPGAARAVGSAMKNNPVCILVPCHRVVRSGGNLGLYSGGGRQKIKEWLLKHEGCQTLR